jgi:hypothetical protein
LRTFGSTQINTDVVSIHLRHPFHQCNPQFRDNCFFYHKWHRCTQIAPLLFDADAVSLHLRYPFHPRNLRFLDNCSFTTDVRRLPQINADVVCLHLRYPFHPRNLRFPDNCSFTTEKHGRDAEKDLGTSFRVVSGQLFFYHRWHRCTQIANLRFDADVISLHLRYPFHPRNLRFPDNCSFTTDEHGCTQIAAD